MPRWRQYLFYTQQCVKTTWTLRIGVLIIAVLTGYWTNGLWTAWIGRSLVCARDLTPSDAILIENFDPNYVLFEQAAALQKAQFAPRILVPVEASLDPAVAGLISQGITELMAKQARIGTWTTIPIREMEPISLNAAVQIRKHLARERITSLIVVTSGFRSRRSALVYRAVLGNGEMQMRCDPVFGRTSVEHWTDTWHGIQKVGEEFLKLQYYRFYVLPFLSRGVIDGP
jgi:hypothetical protein